MCIKHTLHESPKNMKNPILVITNTNWADEMDITGFCILEKDNFEAQKEKLERHVKSHGPFEWSVGSNESIEVDKYELARFKIVENVPEDVASFMQTSFKQHSTSVNFGHSFISLHDQFLEYLKYEGDDEE